MTTIKLDPLTRVEGHLNIEVVTDTVGGVQKVVNAKSAGTMFRGFESILRNRAPEDACHLTQRVCGVCPISHGMAAATALESAYGALPTDNGRIARNLVLGANYLQSHVLHFYHLAALDYVNTAGILDMAPWTPRFTSPDMVSGALAATLVNHYVQALAIRRKAHQLGAIVGGRMPLAPIFVPGGATNPVDAGQIAAFRTLLAEIKDFIDNVYLPDVRTVAGAFPEYSRIGRGCGNLLAYGVFDLNAQGSSKLLARGRYTDGVNESLDVSKITEYVKYSWYTTASGKLNPVNGNTAVSPSKLGAYSWIKAPRYLDKVHEVGPLARMWVNGDYRNGISVLDRLMARVLEAQKVATAMRTWIDAFVPGASVYARPVPKAAASGIGLTEAPRGALGHWVSIAASRTSRYQIVTPTGWNASPMDDLKQHGAIEQALIGITVADTAQPVEVLRVVHSFDPCLSCAVHMVRPGQEAKPVICGTPE